jgi:hypothetical protein
MDRHTRLFASFTMTIFLHSVIARNYVTKQSIRNIIGLTIQWIAALGLFASFAMTIFPLFVIARNYVTKQSIKNINMLGFLFNGSPHSAFRLIRDDDFPSLRHCEEPRDEAIHMNRHTRHFASFAMTIFLYSVIARNYVTKQSIRNIIGLTIQWIATLGFSPRSL